MVPVSREGEDYEHRAGTECSRQSACVPYSEYGNDGVRRLNTRDGAGYRLFRLVMVVGYRGWTRRGKTPDTAATYTEPFLHAFRINYYLVEHDEDGERISEAFAEAQATNRPVVVLVGDEYHGFNR